MNTEVLPANHRHALPHAVDILRNGGIVAFPTDTVYGLAAMAFNIKGVERLYGVKGRSHSKAIAILLHAAEEMKKVAVDVSQDAYTVASYFWPGPLTLIVPRHPDVPEIVSPLPTLGVRIPDHRAALRLLEAAGPLAVTSANLSGEENTNTAREVLDQLEGRVHLVLDGGRSPGGVPSTVLDCTTNELKVLREGPIKLRQIKKLLGGGKQG